MATIYLARLRGPEQFEKLLVLKQIRKRFSREEKFTRMFLDEARIAAGIQHPNVASVFDMGIEQGHYFLAMEYVHGVNLAEVLAAAARTPGTLSWRHAVRIVADAAAGLHAAHDLMTPSGEFLGVVHRDVSPQNILVAFDGSVRVVDFGIAYALERLETTRTGVIKGKVAYMAPEQIEGGDVDRRSDIFSLGIVLYEAVLRRRLFREKNAADAAARILAGDVPPPRKVRPDLPAGLERVILKALQRRPENRFQTAVDLVDALNQQILDAGEYVGQRQVQMVMETLFYDRKRIRDEQIRIAIQERRSKPAIAVGLFGDEVGEPQSSETVAPARLGWSNKRGLLLGGGIVLLVAALLVGALLLGGGRRGQERASSTGGRSHHDVSVRPRGAEMRPVKATRPPGRPAGSPVRRVHLRLTVVAPGARVVVAFRGKKHLGSRFQIAVPASARKEVIRIMAPGYVSRRIAVTLQRDYDLRVRLKPGGRWQRRVRARSYRGVRRRARSRPRPRGDDISMYLKLP